MIEKIVHSLRLKFPSSISKEMAEEWIDHFQREEYDADKLKIVAKHFHNESLVWDDFKGIDNIIFFYNHIFYEECLQDYYIETRQDTFIYLDMVYRKREWNSLLNLKWDNYRKANGLSVEACFDITLFKLKKDLRRFIERSAEWQDEEKQQLFEELCERLLEKKKS